MTAPFFVRIDNRLLHGQVVQFWIPHLGIEHLVVADDEIGQNMAMQAVYRMALPKNVDITVVELDRLGDIWPHDVVQPAMLLIKDVVGTKRIIENGIALSDLTLGNVHAAPYRNRVTDAVYLSEEELAELDAMALGGVNIEIQTFPGEVLRFLSSKVGGPGWGR